MEAGWRMSFAIGPIVQRVRINCTIVLQKLKSGQKRIATKNVVCAHSCYYGWGEHTEDDYMHIIRCIIIMPALADMIDILSKQSAVHIKGTQQKMMTSSFLNIVIFSC